MVRSALRSIAKFRKSESEFFKIKIMEFPLALTGSNFKKFPEELSQLMHKDRELRTASSFHFVTLWLFHKYKAISRNCRYDLRVRREVSLICVNWWLLRETDACQASLLILTYVITTPHRNHCLWQLWLEFRELPAARSRNIFYFLYDTITQKKVP